MKNFVLALLANIYQWLVGRTISLESLNLLPGVYPHQLDWPQRYDMNAIEAIMPILCGLSIQQPSKSAPYIWYAVPWTLLRVEFLQASLLDRCWSSCVHRRIPKKHPDKIRHHKISVGKISWYKRIPLIGEYRFVRSEQLLIEGIQEMFHRGMLSTFSYKGHDYVMFSHIFLQRLKYRSAA